MSENDAGLNFPCAFSVKAIGEGQDYFQFVVEIITEIAGLIDLETVLVRNSAAEKYISVTVPFTAQSRDMLDEIYRRLSADKRTRYVI